MSNEWRTPFVPEGSPLLYRSWADYPVFNFTYSLADHISKCGQYTIYNRFQGFTSVDEHAATKFGIACEESAVEYLRIGGNPEQGFTYRWLKWKDINLKYNKNDQSWFKLFEIGKALMRMWIVQTQKPPLSEVLINPQFGLVFPEDQYKTWHKGTRLEYIADCVGFPPSGPILIDMKTAGKTYAEGDDDHGYCALDPQLQTGALASGIRRVGFIALVKTKEPKIEFVEGVVTDHMIESCDAWLKDQRDKLVDRRLYMRTGVRWPNDHCTMCEYLPKCLGNEELASKTLRVKESKSTRGQLVMIDD